MTPNFNPGDPKLHPLARVLIRHGVCVQECSSQVLIQQSSPAGSRRHMSERIRPLLRRRQLMCIRGSPIVTILTSYRMRCSSDGVNPSENQKDEIQLSTRSAVSVSTSNRQAAFLSHPPPHSVHPPPPASSQKDKTAWSPVSHLIPSFLPRAVM